MGGKRLKVVREGEKGVKRDSKGSERWEGGKGMKAGKEGRE